MVPNEIEDELNNENLDFLEEDDDKSSSNKLINKSNDFNNSPKFNLELLKKIIIFIIIIMIVSFIIYGVIKNKKNQPKKQLLIPEVTYSKSENSPASTTINKEIPNNLSSNKIIENPAPKSVSETKNSDPLKQNDELQKLNNFYNTSTINTLNGSSIPEHPRQTMEQIGEIKLPLNNNNQQQIISPENNLSWQELKKSVDQQANTATNHVETVNDINTNSNNHSTINGFEFKANPAQIAQTNQMNHDYKEQQEYIKEIKKIVANLNNELSENSNKIKELQNHLLELTKSISGINNNINGVDSKVLNLATTLNNLSSDVKNVKKYIQEEDVELNTNFQSSEKDLFSNNPEYVIHAVIPGRAWLKSSSGQIITVAEGDLIGDYGRVASIDATNNIVRTSSGVIFR